MFLDLGYPITNAVQDAMDESKFQQVTNLLQKNPNNEELQKINLEGQNLFHIFARNVPNQINETLVDIFLELKER